MCEYQETIENSIPYCTYTESACTLCVFGNKETYNEAKKREVQNYDRKS